MSNLNFYFFRLANHPKLVQAYGGHCVERYGDFFHLNIECHPHFLFIISFFRATYIVSELMDFNLYQLLIKQPDLDFVTKLVILRDVAEAMEFLHSRGIIHRDLKSVNVLLNNGSNMVAKVCEER